MSEPKAPTSRPVSSGRSPSSLTDKQLIAHLRKRLFRPEKKLLKDQLPFLLEARRRYAQPGRRVPVEGRPTWTKFCKLELGVDIRTVQRWLCDKPPAKRDPDKYTAVDIAHLERVAYAAQKLADANPDNAEYEPIRRAIAQKPSGLFVRNGGVDELEHNKYYEGNKSDGKHYHLTPKKMWDGYQKRYPGIWDCCPYPRPEGYDALKVSWRKFTYCNWPFGTTVDENGKKIGFTAWCRKAIEEQSKGNTSIIVVPMDFGFHLLLNAGAEFRSIGEVKWRATEDGSEQPSGRKIVEIALPGKMRLSSRQRPVQSSS